jgi:hypothetical protein
MRRIQLVLAALAIVVTSFAAFSGSAIADDLDCRNAKGEKIRCDGDLYVPLNDNDHRYHNNYFDPYNYFDYDNYFGYDDDYLEDLEDAAEEYEEEVEDLLEDYEGSYGLFNRYW